MTNVANDPRSWRLRLVGYGEVGRILAEDLRDKGATDIAAYDIKFGTPAGEALIARAEALGVRPAQSHADLVADADLVISAVTASQTVAVAEQCADALPARAFFVDLNSASPSAKQHAGARIDAAGARYVEAAVMTSIPPYRIRVPIRLGGVHAETIAPALSGLGFDVTVAADHLGVASATKMCRSVMIKGLEAMVIECLVSARAYGVEDAVLESLAETFPQIDWDRQATYFFQRVVQHGRRRAEEMREVAVTVSDIGLEPLSAAGTAQRQDWVADLVDAGRLADRDHHRTDWRHDADRILATLERKVPSAGSNN